MKSIFRSIVLQMVLFCSLLSVVLAFEGDGEGCWPSTYHKCYGDFRDTSDESYKISLSPGEKWGMILYTFPLDEKKVGSIAKNKNISTFALQLWAETNALTNKKIYVYAGYKFFTESDEYLKRISDNLINVDTGLTNLYFSLPNGYVWHKIREINLEGGYGNIISKQYSISLKNLPDKIIVPPSKGKTYEGTYTPGRELTLAIFVPSDSHCGILGDSGDECMAKVTGPTVIYY